MPPSHCLVKICSWQLISQFFTLCSCCFSPCFLLRPFAQQKQWPRIIVWNKKRICILDSLEQRPPLYAVDFCLSLGGNTGRDTAPGATAKATIIFCWALTEESRDQQVISKLGRQPGDIDKKPKHKCSRCEWTLNECPQRLAACHRQKLILKTIFYDSIAPPLAPLCIPYAKRGRLDWSDGWFKVLAILLARPFLLVSCLLDMTLRLCFLVFSYILSLLENAEN